MTLDPDDIRSAFLTAVRPAATDIAPHECDECAEIRAFFSVQPQFDIDPERLQLLTAALSLFTDIAFVYWLPAFMLAELANTDGYSDEFADWIGWNFLPTGDGGERTGLLSDRQARVVANILEECAQRYPNPSQSADFAAAATRVRDRKPGQAAAK